MTHIHPPYTASLNYIVTHKHAAGSYTTSTACGFPTAPAHQHGYADTLEGETHYHDVVISFGPADGDTDYATHTHTVYIDSFGAAYGAGCTHDHNAITTPVLTAACSRCIKVGPHTHTHSMTCDNADYTGHTHAYATPAGTTAVPLVGGTKRYHRHYFAVAVTAGGAHTHTLSGAVVNAVCSQGSNHGHAPQTNVSTTHTHTITPFTPYHGERKRALTGVGN